MRTADTVLTGCHGDGGAGGADVAVAQVPYQLTAPVPHSHTLPCTRFRSVQSYKYRGWALMTSGTLASQIVCGQKE